MKFKTLKISVTGKKHKNENKPNQDFCGVRIYKKHTLAVVCDGLGSHECSHIGSKTLVKSAIKLAKNFKFSKKKLDKFGGKLHKKWLEKVASKTQSKRFATTCLMAIITKEYAFLGRAGDGSIVVFDKNYECVKEISEEKGETFSNQTRSFDGRFEWSVLESNKIYSLCLCTDGILQFLAEKKELDFFKSFMNYYENKSDKICKNEIHQMLENMNEKGMGFNDDKTLVALWKKPKNIKKSRLKNV